MDSRERLTRCYKKLETDRPAIYTRTNYPQMDRSYDKLKGFIDKYFDQKRTIVPYSLLTPDNVEIEIFQDSISDDFIRETKIIKSKNGNLKRTKLINQNNLSAQEETYYIKSEDDALIYLSIPDPIIEVSKEVLDESEKIIENKGICDIHLGMNPAGFAVELLGQELFAILSITNRSILYALCEQRSKIMVSLLKKMFEHNIGPFFSILGEEYITPPMHGVKDFYDFNVKYDKVIIDLIHQNNGYVHVHSHGKIKDVLGGFIDMGADVLHPIEAPPMGDVTLIEAKKIIGNDITIEGNIQISNMYESTPDFVYNYVQEMIRDAFYDNKGLIVSPTASPYIHGKGEECFEQYKAMYEAAVVCMI